MGIGADVGGRRAALRSGRTNSEPMDVATPTMGGVGAGQEGICPIKIEAAPKSNRSPKIVLWTKIPTFAKKA